MMWLVTFSINNEYGLHDDFGWEILEKTVILQIKMPNRTAPHKEKKNGKLSSL